MGLSMLWGVRVRALDLHEAFGANGLITASGVVQVWRIVEETDRTFACVFVQIDFDGLPVDKWVLGKLQFPGR